MPIINKRCKTCHKTGGKVSTIPASYKSKERAKLFKRRTAAHERLVIKNDPMARFSWFVMLNTTEPEKSSILMAPLSKKAGGRGQCPNAFESKRDPDYKNLLAAIKDLQEAWLQAPRFGSPSYHANAQYVREMVRFGILPKGTDPKTVDTYKTDRKYWDLFEYQGKVSN